MCYSNSSTSKNVDLSKKYGKKVPKSMDEKPIYFASGFTFPAWRIVTQEETLQTMHWGLIPSWFKGADYKEIASMTLNARVETADEKASFKHLVNRQMCIVPSNGFFEWQTIGKEKIPYFIYPTHGNILSMAGLFDQWQDPLTGILKKTFTILTCPANELMTEIHNSKKRMPVILTSEQEKEWLEGKLNLETLQHPIENSFLQAHEINRKIIGGKNSNSPEILLPFKNEIFEQGSLF
jgi:putative SOS response-associated peptidase YedK